MILPVMLPLVRSEIRGMNRELCATVILGKFITERHDFQRSQLRHGKPSFSNFCRPLTSQGSRSSFYDGMKLEGPQQNAKFASKRVA